MLINKTYNNNIKSITDNFPGWSRARKDPNSQANKLLTPVINIMDYYEDTIRQIHKNGVISRYDTDYEPTHRWIITHDDIEGDSIEDANDNIASINAITGSISGLTSGTTTTSLIRAQSEFEFINPEYPTGWYVADTSEYTHSGIIGDFDVINNVLYTPEISTEPVIINELRLPDKWAPDATLNASKISFIDSFEDENYITYSRVYSTNGNTRLFLDHQLKDNLDIISIYDEGTYRSTGNRVEITSGVNIINTNEYELGSAYVADVDGDGIIDYVDYNLVSGQLGFTRNNYTEEEWEETYSKYDINGNGTIDQDDLQIVSNLMNRTEIDATAIYFERGGDFLIEYTTTNNSAISSAYNDGGVISYLRNNTFGYMKYNHEQGVTSRAYDTHKDIYYDIDNDEKCIIVKQYDTLNNLYDNMKILLPLKPNMELRGITYYDYQIHVLVTSSSGQYIYTILTNYDNPDEHIHVNKIHSGTESDKPLSIVRDHSGLTYNANGLTGVNNSKLVTYDEDQYKLLLPIYDYWYKDYTSETGDYINLRESYDEIDTFPEYNVYPIYMNMWNQADFYGQKKGLRRYPGENNRDYRLNILDVFKHFPGRDKQGSLYGMQRELRVPINKTYKPSLNVLPNSIDSDEYENVKIYDDDNNLLTYDTVDVEPVYRHGKHSHDIISYKSSGLTILTIDQRYVERGNI